MDGSNKTSRVTGAFLSNGKGLPQAGQVFCLLIKLTFESVETWPSPFSPKYSHDQNIF